MGTALRVQIIDVFILILCLRVVYSAIAKGVIREGLKIFGLFVSILIAFHFYSFLGQRLGNISFVNKKYLDFISFLIIFSTVRSIFGFAGLMISFFVKKKKDDAPRQLWACVSLGILRVFLLSSAILFLLQLSPLDSKHFASSYSYKICKNSAPGVYLVLARTVLKDDEGWLAPNKEVKEYYETTTVLSGNN